jgi:hypothetical protein
VRTMAGDRQFPVGILYNMVIQEEQMLQIFTNRWRYDIVFAFELRASNFGIF